MLLVTITNLVYPVNVECLHKVFAMEVREPCGAKVFRVFVCPCVPLSVHVRARLCKCECEDCVREGCSFLSFPLWICSVSSHAHYFTWM